MEIEASFLYLRGLYNQGRFEEAIKVAEKLKRLIKHNLGEQHPYYVIILSNLAMLYHETGRLQDAEPLYQRVIKEMSDSCSVLFKGYYATNLNNLALLYRATGRYKEAEPLFKKAVKEIYDQFGSRHIEYANGLNNLATLYHYMGRFAEARKLYLASLAITRDIRSVQHPEYAGSLNDLAELYRTMGLYKKAERLYKKSVEIRRECLGERHPDYISGINNLGLLYFSTGRYQQAEQMYLKAINACGEQYKKHPDHGATLNNLALVYKVTGRYTEAESLYREALDITSSVLGKSHPNYALYLQNLGDLYRTTGRYEEAELLYLEARDIRREVLGEHHSAYALSLNGLAKLYYAMGRYQKAGDLYREAAAVNLKAFGSKIHPVYAMNLNDLAVLYCSMGLFKQAEELHQEAIKIRGIVLGEKHIEYATSLNNLALLYYLTGRYEEAEPLYLRAMEIRREILGVRHSDYASSRNNLALLYWATGRYDEAEKLNREGMEIKWEALGAMSPDYATGMSNMALMYHSLGRYDKAESLCLEALKIRREALDSRHPDYAASLLNLAALYQDTGRYDEAELINLEALGIYREKLGAGHANYAYALNNQAMLYEAMGRYYEAGPLYVEACRVFRRSLGKRHPEYAACLNNIAILLAKSGKYERALRHIRESININNSLLYRIAAFLPEEQLLSFTGKIEGETSLLITLVSDYLILDREAVNFAFETVLKRKAIVYEATAARHQTVLAAQYSHLQDLFGKLREVRSVLSRKILSGPAAGESMDQYESTLERLEKEQDQLEREIAKQVPEINLQLRVQNADRKAIAKALPQGSTLVEFFRYNPFCFETSSKERWRPARYIAFVMTDQDPEQVDFFDLGDAQTIDNLVAAFRRSISGEEDFRGINGLEVRDGDLENTCRILYDCIFAPVINKIKHFAINQIIIAPDGEICQLPFEALLSPGGRFVIEEFGLSYLNVGRDVTRFGGLQPSGGGAVIVADPDYNLGEEVTGDKIPPDKDGLIINQLRSRRERFEPLPGTRAEGKMVSGLLAGNGFEFKEFYGADALERHIKQVRAPMLLHIATHGFFLPDKGKPVRAQLHKLNFGAEICIPDYLIPSVEERLVENPLLRSGLALAGANTVLDGARAPEDAEDGILSALDVLNINLVGTELVTLSACQTGLGDIRYGEGVAGLRKSFLLSGAKTLIVSLWNIPDYETRLVMESFYKRFLAGENKAEALRKAKLELIEEMRRDEQFPDPWLWAGFICIGDIKPCERWR
ncbi:MAG: CHAT domain-containing protein [Bacillota bacterium]|nr:CHAT domain-containing protein [Bacillota bacterium]